MAYIHAQILGVKHLNGFLQSSYTHVSVTQIKKQNTNCNPEVILMPYLATTSTNPNSSTSLSLNIVNATLPIFDF